MNHDQQPPYPPQPHRAPVAHNEPAQFQHQPYYGPAQPGSQGPPPQKKKSKTAWIVGGIALVAFLLCIILGFVACTALVQDINGGGGSQAEKAAAMMARADKVPQKDWIETYRQNPKVDPGCLSIDTSCLRLTATWTVDHKVSLDEVASRFGMKSGDAGPLTGRYMGCVKKEFDGTSEESLCIGESADGSDSYDIAIQMRRD